MRTVLAVVLVFLHLPGEAQVLCSGAELLTPLPHTSGSVLPSLSYTGINKQLKLCPKPQGYLYKIIKCHLCSAVSVALGVFKSIFYEYSEEIMFYCPKYRV